MIAALAASSRGLFGQISHAWQSLVSTHSVVFDTPGRHHRARLEPPGLLASGAGRRQLTRCSRASASSATGSLVCATPPSTAKADQAHSYLFQTFADLGLIGVVLTVALLGGLVPSGVRDHWRSARGGDSLSSAESSERQGLIALAIVVVTFGIQSCLDFTFYFPGVAIPVLLCAGWLAGRGPLGRPGRPADRAAGIACWSGPEPVRSSPVWRRWR